jgi:hypothetical protein
MKNYFVCFVSINNPLHLRCDMEAEIREAVILKEGPQVTCSYEVTELF